jgi:tetratricopeptide (TPR) repeat protein
MYVQRDYSEPFFGNRRKRRGPWLRRILLLLIVGLIVLSITQFAQIQKFALDAIGMAPTPTASAGDRLNQARDAQSRGDMRVAADLYEQVVAMRPDSVEVINEYGLLLIDMEDYGGAVALGDAAIDADPFNPVGYGLKARGLVWQNDPTAAIPVALTGINVDGRYAPLYAMLARAYAANANYSAAIDSAETAVDIDPQSADARRAYAFVLNFIAEYDAATAELENAMRLEPANVPLAMELAYQYLVLNRDEEAISMYTQVLRLQPRNARAMLRLCRAYRKVGQFNEAMAQCEDAVRADPAYAAAQFQLGLMLYSEPYRDFPAAQQAFNACVQSEPSNVECLFRLGMTHYYEYLAGSESSDGCQIAWQILSDTRRMAQGRANLEATLANIELGMEHVARDCPGNLAAQIPLDLTPVLNVTPTLDPLATPEPTAEPGA